MNLASIKQKAIGLGISGDKVAKMSKADLIASIQTAEGHSACFASKTGGCQYTACCWMADCYAEASRRTGKGRSIRAM